MRMLLLLGLVGYASQGCANQTSDKLVISAEDTELTVGASTTLFAKLADPTTGDEMTVSVSWSASPDGIVTLATEDLAEQVTAVGSGQVLLTASGYGQTQEIGITVN